MPACKHRSSSTTARTVSDSLEAKIALAQSQVISSEARIQQAQQAVDNCTIRSPYAGIVVSKDAQVGEMVSPVSAGGGFTRTGIATIVDMKSNEIEVDVNESYISRVQPGQPVTAILDAYPEWEIPSRVRTNHSVSRPPESHRKSPRLLSQVRSAHPA